MKPTRALAIVLGISIAPLALAGCTAEVLKVEQSAAPTASVDSTAFTGADIMFAQMMIPHHQQAVDMGTLAETRALSPEVKALAAKIKAEQAPEIAQMKGWLKTAVASLDMGHNMGMGGMLSNTQFEALKNSTGTAFDRLFLEGMIAHHNGAIHMAQMVVDSTNAEAAKLGAAIISSQTEQVTYMESLLAK